MYRLFIDDGADAALTPEVFLRPAFAEFAHRAALVPWLVVRATLQALRDPFRRGMMESLATLSHAVPTGMFDNRSIDRFPARACSPPRAAPTISASSAASSSSSRPISTPARP